MTFGDASALGQIDSMHNRDFEQLVADLFAATGYDATMIGGLRDHGADVIATGKGMRLAIQVKHRSKRKWIGERAVRDVHAAREIHDCNGALVVTNSSFAPGTSTVAQQLHVELWDRLRLEAELMSFCVLCHRRVSEKVRDWCVERPEQFGGRVYCYKHQRNVRGLLRTV